MHVSKVEYHMRKRKKRERRLLNERIFGCFPVSFLSVMGSEVLADESCANLSAVGGRRAKRPRVPLRSLFG